MKHSAKRSEGTVWRRAFGLAVAVALAVTWIASTGSQVRAADDVDTPVKRQPAKKPTAAAAKKAAKAPVVEAPAADEESAEEAVGEVESSAAEATDDVAADISAAATTAADDIDAAAAPAAAEATAAAETGAAETTAAAAPAGPIPVDTGSTAWMLISSALVLLMVPGLALFYGGMVRAKNVLNMFLGVMVCCGVLGVLWVVIGYALVFPVVDTSAADADGTNALISIGEQSYDTPDGPVKRSVSVLGFNQDLVALQAFNDPGFGGNLTSGDTVGAKDTGVPELIFVMFQGMFFIITPALIIGSVAERLRFGPMLLFLVIWALVVYCPMAHMVWNVNGYLFQKGVMDFAGGTVVHVLAGVSALALCLVVGPRKGFGSVPMPPHSLGYTLIGAGLLWFGWFGFNAGSAIGMPGAELPIAGRVAVGAFANTQIAAAAAGVAWMLVEWLKDGKPTILGFASGVVAGLVVITPCAGHVAPASSILIGLLGGAVCYFGCQIKKVFKYDDSLDAFGVHGVGGALGAILVGWFAIRPVVGGGPQVGKQFIGLGIAVVLAFVVSLGLAWAIKVTIGLRPKDEDELTGLDLCLHGEKGYHLEEDLIGGEAYTAEGIPTAGGRTATVTA
jgi:Amt family ammonium transporter